VRKLFDPRLDALPDPQREIWAALSAAPRLAFVLYGGTAIALQLGHRQSEDFDFFRSSPLNKSEVRDAFAFFHGAQVIQDSPDTLVILADMPSGSVKVSYFGSIGFGRVNPPLQTNDGTLLVASLEDLMSTKLKTILDRAEAKDYHDIAQMISAGVSLPAGLAAFQQIVQGRTISGVARHRVLRGRRPANARSGPSGFIAERPGPSGRTAGHSSNAGRTSKRVIKSVTKENTP
jgi:hypothetical protein